MPSSAPPSPASLVPRGAMPKNTPQQTSLPSKSQSLQLPGRVGAAGRPVSRWGHHKGVSSVKNDTKEE